LKLVDAALENRTFELRLFKTEAMHLMGIMARQEKTSEQLFWGTGVITICKWPITFAEWGNPPDPINQEISFVEAMEIIKDRFK
jgi:hypothetical protein